MILISCIKYLVKVSFLEFKGSYLGNVVKK